VTERTIRAVHEVSGQRKVQNVRVERGIDLRPCVVRMPLGSVYGRTRMRVGGVVNKADFLQKVISRTTYRDDFSERNNA